jgi:dynein assembly factor 3
VYEADPEVLARHVLLLAVLLDETYPVRDRVETFLEVHGNALLSEKTAAYLGENTPLDPLIVLLYVKHVRASSGMVEAGTRGSEAYISRDRERKESVRAKL